MTLYVKKYKTSFWRRFFLTKWMFKSKREKSYYEKVKDSKK